jgi:hypothetical protein
MPNTTDNRFLLRLAVLVVANIASVILLDRVGGLVGYALVGVTSFAMLVAVAMSGREALQRFRLELLLAVVSIAGVLVATFVPLPPQVVRPTVVVAMILAAVFLVLISIKTAKVLLTVGHR